MSTWQRWYLALGCLMLWAGVAYGETVDRMVAVVNCDIVLYSELRDYIKMLEKATPDLKTDDPARRAQIEREVLQQMIRNHLTDQEVKRLKIVVSRREVDEAIESIKRDNKFTDEQLHYVVQQQGQTLEQFREGIKKDVEKSRLVERVLRSKTVITEQQIDAFLKSNPAGSSGETKDRNRLGIIFLPASADDAQRPDVEKQAYEVHGRLKKGADFAQLAKQYSKGPAAQDGGDIGYIDSEELAPGIVAALRGLKPGDLTDVVKTSTGYYIFKVLDIRSERQSVAQDNNREQARRHLFQQEMNRKFEDWIKDLEARSFIQVSL